jgi:hypothetical protein
MLERRVPSSTRTVHGATLTMSTMGGYSVTHEGDYLGFIHAAQGSLWNTYLRVPDDSADWLGKLRQDDAVLAILRAAGRATEEAAA